jgi:hypothetical protein
MLEELPGMTIANPAHEQDAVLQILCPRDAIYYVESCGLQAPVNTCALVPAYHQSSHESREEPRERKESMPLTDNSG